MVKISKSGVNKENGHLVDQPDPLRMSSVETLQAIISETSTKINQFMMKYHQKSRVQFVDVSRCFDRVSHQLDEASYQRSHHLCSHFIFANFLVSFLNQNCNHQLSLLVWN